MTIKVLMMMTAICLDCRREHKRIAVAKMIMVSMMMIHQKKNHKPLEMHPLHHLEDNNDTKEEHVNGNTVVLKVVVMAINEESIMNEDLHHLLPA